MNIKSGSFFPAPKVDSTLVRLTPPPAPRVKCKDEEAFFKVVRRSFTQRRKTLLSSLSHKGILGVSKEELGAILDRLGIDYTPYYLVNAIEVEAGPLLRLWLSARHDVDRVLNSPVLRPLYAPNPAARGSAAAPSTHSGT